ncbi:MAG: argininosuccinate lyase [Candidatus Omnitrophota bacterium]
MAKKMWGGRFKKKIDKDFDAFQKSIDYDYRLAKQDILHSTIHTYALLYTRVLTPQEAKRLLFALKQILSEIKNKGKLKYNSSSEDIHTEIQNRLEKKLKDVALKLQSFRSRNDQVVFDERMYCIREAMDVLSLIYQVEESLEKLADKYKKDFFVGYTHTQRAQVIKFPDYLLSFAGMFERDAKRIFIFFKDLEVPIGCGALTGSYIKKEDYKKAIGKFGRLFKESLPGISLTKNPLDNISDRDFIIEFLSILSILQMHLSRLAEDFILYSTKEFDFFDLPEEFCTGSSLMPHKKNPDFLELVRGYSGRVCGNLISVLTTMKGLPLSYNRDMQLDKEPLFSSVDIIKDELKILSKFIKGVRLNKPVIQEALRDENLYATEFAEYLIKNKLPHKRAHTVIGKLISYSEQKKQKIGDMDDQMLAQFHPALTHKAVKRILNPRFVVEQKRSIARKG